MKKILLLLVTLLCYNLGYTQTTYTSEANGAWSSDATWSGSGTPGASDTAVIDGETVQVTSSVTVAKLTMSAGLLAVDAALTVSNSAGESGLTGGTMSISGANVTISDGDFSNNGTISISAGKNLVFSSGTGDTFTNNGTVTLASTSEIFASIIFNGTYSADENSNMQYSRYVEGLDVNWDLIGNPLNGYSIYTFIGDNNDLSFQAGTSERGIGVYDNSDNTWDTYSQSDALFLTFTTGDGYQMATDTGANIEFKGDLKSGNVTKTLTYNETDPPADTGGTKFNLVANPYAAYINANTNADGTNCFLDSNNLGELYAGVHQAIWAWDGAADSGSGEYSTITNATAAKYIAPGQGFMVGSQSGGGTLTFTAAMQTTATTDDFYTGDVMDPDDRAELFIGLNQGEREKYTEIYFIDEGSDAVDPSYDGALMELNNNSTSIFSRLVEGDQGTNIAVNALAYSEMWDKVIPIGINAMAGEELTVSVTHKTTPADLKIYLEDAQEGTFTLINNEDFVLTPTSDLSGIGRFFIHTTADTLSNEEVNTSILNAYKGVDNNYITIEGLATQATSTEVSLYNILGIKVMDTTLDNTVNTQTISTNGFSTGIYIIKLESGKNQLTKKLIIK